MTSSIPQGHLAVAPALRSALAAVALVALALSTHHVLDFYAGGIVIIVAFGTDFSAFLSLRNLFVVYATGLFVYGNHLIYPNGSSFAPDLFIYLASFMATYVLFARAYASRRRLRDKHQLKLDLSGAITSRIEALLKLVFVLEMVRVVLLIAPYGLTSFYSGQELADRISSYSQAGSTGITTIGNLIVTMVATAVVVVYVEHCLQAGRAIKYRLLVLVLLIPPLLALERVSIASASILLLAVYVCQRRARNALGTRGARRRRTGRQILVAAVVLTSAVGIGLAVGNLRARRLSVQGVQGGATSNTLETVFRGEFTTIIFYRDVKEKIGVLGYQYGEPIVGALLTRAVPRFVWPAKPITSQEYYMQRLRPQELRAGFSLAPSLFGVAYLNFGGPGVMLIVGLLGLLFAYADRGYVYGDPTLIPRYLIVATWFYSLLRDDLSTSVFSVVMTFAIYGLIRRSFARASTSVATKT